ncbi:MAG: class I SAM-dependent methyltransferase [Calditrichaceae bacterium]
MLFRKWFILCSVLPILLTAQGRDSWQKPAVIMDSVGIKSGMIIGEIGAGDGYFTFKMVDRIGPEGHIFANDIVQSKLDYINNQCRERKINTVTTILGEENDSLFPKDTLDLIIMVYTFHHLGEPVAYLNNLRKRLKPGTPVVIVERDPERYGYEYNHFFKKDKVFTLIEKADYKLEKLYTFLARDNIYVITP